MHPAERTRHSAVVPWTSRVAPVDQDSLGTYGFTLAVGAELWIGVAIAAGRDGIRATVGQPIWAAIPPRPDLPRSRWERSTLRTYKGAHLTSTSPTANPRLRTRPRTIKTRRPACGRSAPPSWACRHRCRAAHVVDRSALLGTGHGVWHLSHSQLTLAPRLAPGDSSLMVT